MNILRGVYIALIGVILGLCIYITAMFTIISGFLGFIVGIGLCFFAFMLFSEKS